MPNTSMQKMQRHPRGLHPGQHEEGVARVTSLRGPCPPPTPSQPWPLWCVPGGLSFYPGLQPPQHAAGISCGGMGTLCFQTRYLSRGHLYRSSTPLSRGGKREEGGTRPAAQPVASSLRASSSESTPQGIFKGFRQSRTVFSSRRDVPRGSPRGVQMSGAVVPRIPPSERDGIVLNACPLQI
jgi:hypothetical protein